MELRPTVIHAPQKNMQTFSFGETEPADGPPEPLFSSTPGNVSPSFTRSPRSSPRKNVSHFGNESNPAFLLPERLAGLAALHTQIANRLRMKFKKHRDAFWALGGSRDGSLTYADLLHGLVDAGIDLSMDDLEDLLGPFSSNHQQRLILFPELAKFLTQDPLTVAHTPISSVEESPRPAARQFVQTRHEELSAGYEDNLDKIQAIAQGLDVNSDQFGSSEDVEPAVIDDSVLAILVPHISDLHETLAGCDRAGDGSVSLLELRETIRFVQPQFQFNENIAVAILQDYPAASRVNGRIDYLHFLERIAMVRPENIDLPPPPSLPKELFIHLGRNITKLREAEALFREKPSWCLTLDELSQGLLKMGVVVKTEHLKLLLSRHVCDGTQENKPVTVGEYVGLVNSIPSLTQELGIPATRRPRALHSMVLEKFQTHRQGAGGNYVGIYRQMDQSGTGLLAFGDFKKGVAGWGLPLSDEEVETLLSPFDRNNDKRLTYQEFAMMINQPVPEGSDDLEDRIGSGEGSGSGKGKDESESETDGKIEIEGEGENKEKDEYVYSVIDRVTAALGGKLQHFTDVIASLDRHHNGRLSHDDASAAIESALINATAEPLPIDDYKCIMQYLDPNQTGIVLTSELVPLFTPNTIDLQAELEGYLEWVRKEIKSRLDVRMGGSKQRDVYQFFEAAGYAVGAQRIGRGLSNQHIVAGAKRLDLDISESTVEGVFAPYMSTPGPITLSVLFKFLSQD